MKDGCFMQWSLIQKILSSASVYLTVSPPVKGITNLGGRAVGVFHCLGAF